MAKDAQRASDVVKRLRDFFRTGSTQLQTVSPAVLLNEAIDAQQRRAEALNIRVDSDIDDNLQPVLVDPVQIVVVLRNLVANALDAATTAMEAGRVAVRAREHGRELLVEVTDNGAGVATTRLDTLFDAGASDKPGGMGVGLSICRAIVEAHGGRLWAEAGTSGCFCLALPLDGRTTMGNDDAA
jgi:signal transduction histidine kinase